MKTDFSVLIFVDGKCTTKRTFSLSPFAFEMGKRFCGCACFLHSGMIACEFSINYLHTLLAEPRESLQYTVCRFVSVEFNQTEKYSLHCHCCVQCAYFWQWLVLYVEQQS